VSRRRNVYLGSASAVFQAAISIGSVGIGLPILLSTLGMRQYGIFSVVSVVSALGTLTSSGLNGALIYYVGVARDRDDANVAILGNLVVSVLAGCTVLCLGLLFEEGILKNLLGVSDFFADQPKLTYRFSMWAGLFLTVGQSFVALLDVQQRNYLSNLLQSIYTVTYWSLCTLFAWLFHSLSHVALASLIAAVAWFLITSWYAIRLWGRLDRFVGWRSLLQSSLSQARYGGQLFLANQMGFFYEPFTKVLVSKFIGVEQVTVFDVALRIKTQVWSLFGRMLYPINPLLARTHDLEEIRLLVTDVSQKLAMIMVPICMIAVAVAKPGIVLWLGNPDPSLPNCAAALTCAHLLGIIGLPMYHFLIAKGYPGKVVIVQLINVAINTAVFFAAIGQIGFTAVPLANGAAAITSLVYLLYLQRHRFDITAMWSKKSLFSLTAVLVGCGSGYLLLASFDPSAVVVLCIYPLIVISTAILVYRLSSLFSESDITRYLGKDSVLSHLFVTVFVTDR
jgi:O-antigen/teichoic acid export membrane protein